MKKLLVLILAMSMLVFIIACDKNDDDDDDSTGPSGPTSFNITLVESQLTPADANPEIVRMVPGTDDQAVFIASATNQLYPITYSNDGFSIGNPFDVDPGSATAEMTSIDVSIVIDGENYVAVCVAEVDCELGSVHLVRYSDNEIVATVGVGYNPDGCSFTKDGSYLVVACEDDREDRECKPEDRHGGSVAIIDLRNGVENAELLEDFKVDWDVDSEPEHAETAANGTTVVSIQETSQIMIFNANDVPLTEGEYIVVDLPDDGAGIAAEPDGLYISPDGTLALISNERNGTFQMMELPTGNLLGTPYIIEDDLPDGYNVDAREPKKRTEPEECSLVSYGDKLYAILALQESHGVIVYDVTDPANPEFDSIAPCGVDYENDIEMEKSSIGTEGLSAHATNGMVLVANEREGSITLLRAGE